MLLFHLLVLRRGNCCGRINVHLMYPSFYCSYICILQVFLVSACFPHSHHTHREQGLFHSEYICRTHVGEMHICVWASAHHELVCVSLKERCPGLYLLMAKVCFSDVSNIIPCYQRLICLSWFDSCLFRASGQSQSQSRLRTPAQRLMWSALFILRINLSWSEDLWICFQRPDSSSASGL